MDTHSDVTKDVATPENPYVYERASLTSSSRSETDTYFSPPAPLSPPSPDPEIRKVSRGQAIKAFIFGIVALECCQAPFISIIAIIFGSLAKKNGAKLLLEAPTGATRVFSTLGKIFGLIGFIIGIIMTAISPFWLIGFISGLIDSLEFSLFL